MNDLNTHLEPVADQGLKDGEARFEAINPTASYIVQAPAGSGKTALLTQRFLALLARVEQPEQIVAMTFTQKAAAEMRERIIGTLKLGRAEQPPADASLFEVNSWRLARTAYLRNRDESWNLLENPNRLRIKTIDGVNGFLVAQMPLLSRMGAQPQISRNADRLYVEAVRMLLKDADCAEEMAGLLKLVNGRYHRAENLLVTMLKKRDQWMGSLLAMQGEAARETLEYALELIVKQEMRTHLAHLQGVRPLLEEALSLADYAVSNDQPWLQPLCDAPRSLGDSLDTLPQWRLLAEWLLTKDGKSVRKSVTKNIGFPAGKGEAKAHKDQFLNLLEGLRCAVDAEAVLRSLNGLRGLPDPVYDDEQWQNLQALIRLLQRAAGYLKVVFRSRGEADFIEVAQAASQALGSELEPTELAQQLDYQIQHLLVDEFQDTSSEQYALITKLVAGWQPGDGRTLFIVGDPMQSIYRFREAEVGNFLKAWQGRLGEVILKPLNLEVNFRSSRSVVDWVNRTFAKVFPARSHIETGAVAYTAASAQSDNDDEAVFSHWRLNQSPESESVEIVQLVKRRLKELAADSKGETKQIALLGRTRSSLMMIASLLKQQGVGFRAVELEALQARQEIQDCLSLSRALLHLGDRPAWIALLRAPLVGLSLNDLHLLLGEHFYQPVWTLIQPERWPDGLSKKGRVRLQSVLPVLQGAIERLGSLPFSVVVRECWLQLDGAHSVEEKEALENVEVFWQTLEATDREALTHDRLQELMAGLYARPDAAPQSQQVQLMTMHKSKGLEFDTVILPGLGRKPRAGDTELVAWQSFLGPLPGYEADDPNAPAREWLVMAPLDQRGRKTSRLSGLLKQFEQEKQDYELARLLYVAATRAKQRLYLFGSVNFKLSERDDAAPVPQKGSLLEPLWGCVSGAFGELAMAYEEVEEALDAPDILPKVSRLPLSRSAFTSWLGSTFEKRAESGVELSEKELKFRNDSLRSGEALLNTSVGNLVHAVLEQVVEQGVPDWNEAQVESRAKHYALWLNRQGLEGDDLERAGKRVQCSLKNACRNPKVRWALDSAHQGSATEYPLTSLNEESGVVENHIVDRTFVDESGTRWIIDYKTSYFEGSGADCEAFVEQQVTVYRDQLARYGRLFAELDGETTAQKWVLYFTHLDRWVELPL